MGQVKSQRVGMVGLGAMGVPMALRLLEAYGELHLAGRSPRPALVEAGATWHASYSDLASACDVVLFMLPDLPEAEAVLFGGPDGAEGFLHDAAASPSSGASPSGASSPSVAPEQLIVIGSTSSAVGVRELARRVSEASGGRVALVDAPVSGGVDGAEAGTLSIMMGGAEEHCARVAQALSPCGTAVRLGPVGAGEVAKACNQLVVSATILALGEATVLAERSGLDVQAMWDLLDGGYASSRLLDTRKQRLVEHNDSPSGAAKYLLKDLRCGLEVARDTNTAAEALPALEATFSRIVATGLGDNDMSVTRRYIADHAASGTA